MTKQPFQFKIKRKNPPSAPENKLNSVRETKILNAPKYPLSTKKDIARFSNQFKDPNYTIERFMKEYLNEHVKNVQSVYNQDIFPHFGSFIFALNEKVTSKDFRFENAKLIEKEKHAMDSALSSINKKIDLIEKSKSKTKILINESKTENQKHENLKEDVAEFCVYNKFKAVDDALVDENNNQINKDYVYNIAKNSATHFNSYINKIMMKLKTLADTLNEKIKEEDKLFEDAYGEFAGGDESFITKIN